MKKTDLKKKSFMFVETLFLIFLRKFSTNFTSVGTFKHNNSSFFQCSCKHKGLMSTEFFTK